MKTFFVSKNLSLKLKIKMVRCYILPVLLYGVEAWTMTEALMRKLESFEMWIYWRILRISQIEHTTNKEVLKRMDKTKEVTFTIKRRNIEYLGHIMRNNKYLLLQLILQGKVDGRRGPGRRRNSWLQNVHQWFGMSSLELFRQATDKSKNSHDNRQRSQKIRHQKKKHTITIIQ